LHGAVALPAEGGPDGRLPRGRYPVQDRIDIYGIYTYNGAKVNMGGRSRPDAAPMAGNGRSVASEHSTALIPNWTLPPDRGNVAIGGKLLQGTYALGREIGQG